MYIYAYLFYIKDSISSGILLYKFVICIVLSIPLYLKIEDTNKRFELVTNVNGEGKISSPHNKCEEQFQCICMFSLFI